MSKLCYLVLRKQVQDMRKEDNLRKDEPDFMAPVPVLFKEDMSALDIAKAGIKQTEQSQIEKPRKGVIQPRKKRFYSGCLDK